MDREHQGASISRETGTERKAVTAYYNDNDPFAAAWLRELIKANLIAPGEVDERNIEEVKPDDLRGFTQCHFFAGIGVWSYALRNAGWADATPVWTGSCPCQGFSASGQRGGFSDKRHLWPAWFWLISECRPVTVFGEQVASKDGLAWLDVVSADMEGAGYAIGAADTCAAGFGAPHIRQRLYFVANTLPAGRAEGRARARRGSLARSGVAGECSDAAGLRREQRREGSGPTVENLIASRGETRSNCGGQLSWDLGGLGSTGDGEHATAFGLSQRAGEAPLEPQRKPSRETQQRSGDARDGSDSDGGNASTERLQRSGQHGLRAEDSQPRDWRGPGWLHPSAARAVAAAGATRGFWSDCDWWYGRDGKYRPIGAGLFPLVAGATGRMGKLRGYGNAICAPQAQGFIEAYMTI